MLCIYKFKCDICYLFIYFANMINISIDHCVRHHLVSMETDAAEMLVSSLDLQRSVDSSINFRTLNGVHVVLQLEQSEG